MSATDTDQALQILIVDDEENILRSLKRLLMNEDYEILTAMSGEEALGILGKNPDVALIISDQRMPGLTGTDFLEKAALRAPDATRMILTGYADVTAAIEGINRGGAYRYITKPWNDSELIQTVNEAVLRYGLIKDNQRLTRKVKDQNRQLEEVNSQLMERVREQFEEIQKQNENLRKNFKSTISAFSNLIELRDRSSANHSRNVAELSKKMAERLSLDNKDIQTIVVASLLHDIGKIGIPDVLLAKDTEDMNDDEKEIYWKHTVRGQTAVDAIEDLREAGILIRHHHEWYDGTGYPDGLSAVKIPIGSRIIHIADFIDRTIRRFTGESAIGITLKRVSHELGKRFDRKLFALLEEPAREIYAGLLNDDDLELELQPKDLKPGMTISKEVRSGTGLLILRKGTVLDEKNIESLKRSYRHDPARSGIFVNVEKG